jgi:hypothetical protein
MDADLRPWLEAELNASVILSEFPYHQYRGDDHPAVAERAELLNCDPAEISGDWIRQEGPFRTDLVAVMVDWMSATQRANILGHLTPLNQPRSGKRKYRRTYLNFVKDGPMEREYYENCHGTSKGEAEPRGYGAGSARPAFGWLKKRGFLHPHPAGGWDAVTLPLVIAEAHAIELKIYAREWETALEQASRADVFADYRWVAYDESEIGEVLPHAEAFEARGVGLLAVSQTGVRVCVQAVYDPPKMDDAMLNRYMVERWDLNERVVKRIQHDVPTPEMGMNSPPLVHSDDAVVRRAPEK